MIKPINKVTSLTTSPRSGTDHNEQSSWLLASLQMAPYYAWQFICSGDISSNSPFAQGQLCSSFPHQAPFVQRLYELYSFHQEVFRFHSVSWWWLCWVPCFCPWTILVIISCPLIESYTRVRGYSWVYTCSSTSGSHHLWSLARSQEYQSTFCIFQALSCTS